MSISIAIVTGATSGLGRAFLEEWKRAGRSFDEVWLVARHEEMLARTAATLPWQTQCFALDLSDADERQRMVQALAEAQPDVRMLVSSAGWGKAGRARSLNRNEVQNVIALNVAALTDLTLAVLPYCGRGSILFEIASTAAFLPQPSFSVYAASKAYVQSFSRALYAEERVNGIRVVSVCPNPMLTGFFERAGMNMQGVKRIFAESPQAVAHRAMADAEKGRDVSVNCAAARAVRLAAKALPHRLLLKLEAVILR